MNPGVNPTITLTRVHGVSYVVSFDNVTGVSTSLVSNDPDDDLSGSGVFATRDPGPRRRPTQFVANEDGVV